MDVTARDADPGAPGQAAPDLVQRLRTRTRALHTAAERSGVLRELLRGRATRAAYALLLRNLHAPYTELESALRRHAQAPGVRRIAMWDLRRREALESDLRVLGGIDWAERLPLLPAARAYATQIATAQARHPGAVVAHAYVRYLGDLSGGQMLRRLLATSQGLGPEALGFYSFEDIADVRALVPEYLAAIDAAGLELGTAAEAVVEEAEAAFRCNIAVSEEVFASASAFC